MKTSSAKAKGRELQKWIAEKISEITGIKAGKDEMIESRGMGQSGVDVVLRGEAAKLFPFSIEAKRVEKLSVSQWIEQAKSNVKEGTDWLLIFRRSREKACVVMDAEVFFKIFKKTLDKQG
jgi:hypothetical protein